NGSTRVFDVATGAVPELTLSGVLSNGGLGKLGPGVLLLTALNTFTGPTAIHAGVLRTGAPGVLPGTSNVIVDAGATLDLAAANQTIGGLSGGGNVTLGSATLTIAESGSHDFTG